MTLELHATSEEVIRAVEALQQFGQEKQLPEMTISGLALALEECGSNIVNHALQRDRHQKFQVVIEHTESGVTIELRDRGPEFDPTQARGMEPAHADDDRPPGGWGIQLVRRYTDEIRYAREGGENVLRLTKRLVSASGKEWGCPPKPKNGMLNALIYAPRNPNPKKRRRPECGRCHRDTHRQPRHRHRAGIGAPARASPHRLCQ